MKSNYKFGKIQLSESEIFQESKHSIGIVNLKPITPGHLLIIPKRVVLRYAELSFEEVTDLTELAIKVAKILERDFIWLIQDGKEAGQTVSHVHLHLIPKRFSEWHNDIEDTERIPRTLNDMKIEADQLRNRILLSKESQC